MTPQFHIPYVLPLALDEQRRHLIQYNTMDQLIHRVQLTEREYRLLSTLLTAHPEMCTYATMMQASGTDLDAVRQAIVSLNAKIARCNVLVEAVQDEGFSLMHIAEHEEIV